MRLLTMSFVVGYDTPRRDRSHPFCPALAQKHAGTMKLTILAIVAATAVGYQAPKLNVRPGGEVFTPEQDAAAGWKHTWKRSPQVEAKLASGLLSGSLISCKGFLPFAIVMHIQTTALAFLI